MRVMYKVVLMRERREDGGLPYIHALHWHIPVPDESERRDDLAMQEYEWHLHHEENILDKWNEHELLFYVATYDRGVMLNARIKCECEELKNTVEHHTKLLREQAGSYIQDETFDLCVEIQKIYMKKIGRLVRRLLTRVNDGKEPESRAVRSELALQCYDILERETEAERAYHKLDQQLNREYYRSLVNEYC